MEDFSKINYKLNTKFLGRNFIYFEEIGSTQEYIKQKLKLELDDGLVVVTEKQTAGIGTNREKMVYKARRKFDFFFFT